MAEQEFTTNELQSEIWKAAPGYETHYSVSNIGRIRRDARGCGTQVGRILKPGINTDGYPFVDLSVRGHTQKTLVHVLVARAFIGPTPQGKEVNHIDGQKLNARMTNLEYLTRIENNRHARRMGLIPPQKHGTENHWAKLSTEQVLAVRKMFDQGTPVSVIASAFDITVSHVYKIGQRTTWRHLAADLPTVRRSTRRGTRHAKAILTENAVRQIREEYKKGNTSERKLAIRFGVSRAALRGALLGKTWKHVI